MQTALGRLRGSEQEALARANEVTALDQDVTELRAQLALLQDRSKHIRTNADMRDVKLRAELTRLEVRRQRALWGCVSPVHVWRVALGTATA